MHVAHHSGIAVYKTLKYLRFINKNTPLIQN
jgi:hypothetical protein